MKVWWRDSPLEPREEELLKELSQAHYASAFRENSSTIALIQAAAGSQQMASAIAAALMTLGGRHAPLEQTIEFLSLDNPEDQALAYLEEGAKIPGWGGSFQGEDLDEGWKETALGIQEMNPSLFDKILAINVILHAQGKMIYPNPSALTAAVCLTLEVPKKAAVYLLIKARLDAWAQIALSQMG